MSLCHSRSPLRVIYHVHGSVRRSMERLMAARTGHHIRPAHIAELCP
jgi:hypothetical protein